MPSENKEQVTLDKLLSSDNFTLSKTKIALFDPTKLEKAVEFNLEGALFTESAAIDDLVKASALTDGSDAPQTPSYQPQNEAGIAISGTFLQKSAMGSSVNNAVGILDKSLEFLKNSAMLSPEFYETANFTTELIQDSNKVLSTGAMSLANSSEKANGGIIFSSATDFKVGGNNIYFGSEGSIHETTPIKSSVTGTKIEQSKAHHTTADVKTEHLKDKFQHVERTKHTIAKNVQKTALATDRTYAAEGSYTATEGYTTTAKNLKGYANDVAQTSSKNIVYVTAEGPLVNQAGQINITASAGTITSGNPTKAEGYPSNDNKISSEIDGSINILAHGQTGQGKLSMIAQSTLRSAVEDAISLTGGKDIKMAKEVISSAVNTMMASAVSSTIYGGASAGIQTATTALKITRRVTKIGRTLTIQKITPYNPKLLAEVVKIPALPTLPGGITTQQLESCIPDKFKPKNDTDNIDDTSAINNKKNRGVIPSKEEIGRREKSHAQPTTKTQTTIPTQINGAGTSTSGRGNENDSLLGTVNQDTLNTLNTLNILDQAGTANGEGTKMPPSSATSTNTSPTAQNQPAQISDYTVGANGVYRGGLDIFYEEEVDDSVTAYDPENINNNEYSINGTDDVENAEEYGITAKDAAGYITENIIVDVARELGINPSTVLRYKDSFELFFEKDIEEIGGLEEYLKNLEEYKELLDPKNKKLVAEIIHRVYGLIGVGGLLGGVRNTVGLVSKTVGVLSNINKEKEDIFQIVNTISNSNLPGVSDVTKGITSLINSNSTLSSLTSIGRKIVGGKEIDIEKEIETVIKKSLEKKLKEVLTRSGLSGLANNNTILLQVIEEIKNIEIGKPVSKEFQEGVINKITNLIRSQPTVNKGINSYEQAKKIYKEVNTVIEQVEKGDINSILSGEGITDILGYVLGPSNVGVLREAQGTYKKGKKLFDTLKSVPTLINLMNSYRIPLLNQINITLSCLDLMNQVIGLIDSLGDLLEEDDNSTAIEGKSNTRNSSDQNQLRSEQILNRNDRDNNSNTGSSSDNFNDKVYVEELNRVAKDDKTAVVNEAIKYIEDLPRLVQIYNSVKEIPTGVIKDLIKEAPNSTSNMLIISDLTNIPNIPNISTGSTINYNYGNTNSTRSTGGIVIEEISKEEIEIIKSTEIEVPISPCYTVPRLNYLESGITVKEIKGGKILFSVTRPQLLEYNDKDIKPGVGTVVQLRIERFRNSRTNNTLEVYREGDYFSPLVYSFEVIDYLEESNIGLAAIIPIHKRIYLRSSDKVVYEYDIYDIGGRLRPEIKDSYLLL